MSAYAADAGHYTAALRGQELLGKSLGLFTDKAAHLSVKTDASQAHLQALMAMAQKRAAEPL